MPFMRFKPGQAAAAGGAALAMMLAVLPARGDEICDSLTTQLAGVPRASSPARSGLMRQLQQMQFAADQYGCARGGGGFFGMMMQSPVCPQINWRMSQLRRQLSGVGAYDPVARYQRQRILDAMAQNGCAVPQQRPQFAMSGRLRTLCVRSCDGYFFPISYATSRSRLKIDEAVCKGMYPDGEATLFVTRSDDDSARAVSLKGEVYAAQSYANAFQKNFVPACKAKLTEGLAGLADRFAAAQEEFLKSGKGKTRDDSTAGAAAPVPQRRPASWEDPETLANRGGGFTIEPVQAKVAETEPTNRPVRVIGDGLFPPPVGIAENSRPSMFPPGRIVRERKPVKASVIGEAGE